MKSKAWIVVAKIIAIITALYAVVLITQVVKAVNMYNANPEAYNNGLAGILGDKIFEIIFIILSIAGTVLFFLHSKIGWAIQAAMQLLFLGIVVASASFALAPDSGKSGLAGAIVFVLVLLLISLTGLLSIFSPAVRTRYDVGLPHYVSAAVFAALVIAALYI